VDGSRLAYVRLLTRVGHQHRDAKYPNILLEKS
jgi:hypothetical protein